MAAGCWWGGHCGRTRPHGANAVGQCHTSTAGYGPCPVQVGDFPGARRGSRAPSARAAGCPASGPPPCQDDCAARAVSRSFGATPSWHAQQSVLGGGSWYQRPAAGLHPVRGRGSRCSPPRAGPGDVCGVLRASTRRGRLRGGRRAALPPARARPSRNPAAADPRNAAAAAATAVVRLSHGGQRPAPRSPGSRLSRSRPPGTRRGRGRRSAPPRGRWRCG